VCTCSHLRFRTSVIIELAILSTQTVIIELVIPKNSDQKHSESADKEIEIVYVHDRTAHQSQKPESNYI
jgi:hypothetical protein